MKLLFRRVKEGTIRLETKKILAGTMFIALLPVTLLVNQPTTIPATPKTWHTELVLADRSPELLTARDQVVMIEKVPSRYDEEVAKQEAERHQAAEQAARIAAESAAREKARQTAQVMNETPSACNSKVSDSEKWDWAGKAASTYNIPTQLLAAVWQIESGKQFCTTVQSHAGAKGPLQFVSGTWNKYAHDGNGDGVKNVFDARDALFGAAKLLAANGANQGDYSKALYAYNHSARYVAQVKQMAHL